MSEEKDDHIKQMTKFAKLVDEQSDKVNDVLELRNKAEEEVLADPKFERFRDNEQFQKYCCQIKSIRPQQQPVQWYKRLFFRPQNPAVKAMFDSLKENHEFNKNELKTIRKQKMFKAVNQYEVELVKGRNFTNWCVVATLSILLSLIITWIACIILFEQLSGIDFLISWFLGIAIGRSMRFFWDGSYGRKKLTEKIKNDLPWIEEV